VLGFRLSPDFHVKQSVEAPPAAGAKAADLVFFARARATRSRRARQALTIAAALAAPVLALNAHWSAERDVVAPMAGAIPVASAEQPAAALPHIVTRQAPAAPSRIARDGIDFTATSATAPDAGADKRPGAAAPKPVAKKKKAELPR
jgi:hypothetical protein